MPPASEKALGDDASFAGPDGTFATVLAELTLSGKNLGTARSLAAQVLSQPPEVIPA